jgi:hypothetical protein
VSYALAVAGVVKYENSDKITDACGSRHLSNSSGPMEQNFITGRMHRSGLFFYCPRCELSFPHPPHVESFYHIGYGFCWYCIQWIPLEGGDKKGIVRVDGDGELYTEYYEAEDRRKDLEHERRVRELCGLDKPRKKK